MVLQLTLESNGQKGGGEACRDDLDRNEIEFVEIDAISSGNSIRIDSRKIHLTEIDPGCLLPFA